MSFYWIDSYGYFILFGLNFARYSKKFGWPYEELCKHKSCRGNPFFLWNLCAKPSTILLSLVSQLHMLYCGVHIEGYWSYQVLLCHTNLIQYRHFLWSGQEISKSESECNNSKISGCWINRKFHFTDALRCSAKNRRAMGLVIAQLCAKIDPVMMTSSNGRFSELLALCAGNSPVTGECPSQRPMTPSFDIFFDLHLNKRLSKQSWRWWFEMSSRSLRRHRNVSVRSCRHRVDTDPVRVHYDVLAGNLLTNKPSVNWNPSK